MADFFTADTHFDDASILGYENRPFANVNDMNEAILANFSSVLTKKDDLWIVGDFMKGANADRAKYFLSKIPARCHLVFGNHDRETIRSLPLWASAAEKVEFRSEKQPLTLLHYPMMCWNGSHINPEDSLGSIMLFGHIHSLTRGWNRCINVGVDVWDFKPASLHDIQQRSASITRRIPFLGDSEDEAQ